MFDPTAFDNLKVIIEGAMYDRDLAGELMVIDRNDWLNVAKLSRSYNITIQRTKKARVSAKLRLHAGLTELAAELIHSEESGVFIQIDFQVGQQPDDVDVLEILKGIWGHDRKYVTTTVSEGQPPSRNAVTYSIHFERIIYEDQVDDLLEMVEFVLLTLTQLEKEA